MSNTRRAIDPGAEIAQERYLSSPVYVEQKGIAGNAVAAKAELLIGDAPRALLFFLQGQSIRPGAGGVKGLAIDLLKRFPGRIGTQTMQKIGIRKGTLFGKEDSSTIVGEMRSRWRSLENRYAADCSEPPDSKKLPVDEAIAYCRQILEREIPEIILKLCIDPKVRVPLFKIGDVADAINEVQDEVFLQSNADAQIIDPGHPFFRDLMGALYEYKEQIRNESFASVAKTSIAETIWQNLDHCRRVSKICVIQGESRIGKTTPLEAYCAAYPGEVRFVSLNGVTSKTTFFRLIARAAGIAHGVGRSSTDIQARVEEFFHRSRLMLVIDEAAFAFPQSRRIYSHPELIDWIDTALFNHKVPVALASTPAFSERLHAVESQTGWRAAQFRCRISRFVKLPDKPTVEDVEKVIHHLLPYADSKLVDAIFGYAFGKDQPLPAATRLIDEALMIAGECGRTQIILGDVKKALTGVVVESDLAMLATIAPKTPKRGVAASALPMDCNMVAEQPENVTKHGRRTENLPASLERNVSARNLDAEAEMSAV